MEILKAKFKMQTLKKDKANEKLIFNFLKNIATKISDTSTFNFWTWQLSIEVVEYDAGAPHMQLIVGVGFTSNPASESEI